MATYVKPAKGTPGGVKYGTYTKFGMGMPANAKQQKGAAAKPGAGLWGLGIDPGAPNVDELAEQYLARLRNPDGTYRDWKGNPNNWLNNYYNQVLAENPGIRPGTALDAAFRMQMQQSSKPPKNFFTEYLMDPLVEGVLGAAGNFLVPGLGTIAATGYGVGRGASENGLIGGLLGGFGGYAAGQFGTSVLSGIDSAGGVGNYLSNLGTSAYNAVTNLPSTIGNLGKDLVNTVQYGPELTNLNAAIANTAPSAAQGMAAGASGAMRAAADAANAGGFLNNLLPGSRAASSVGTLGSSAAGGGGMDWGDIFKLAVDVGVPIYTASQTQKALEKGAAAQTAAVGGATALQREMFEKGLELQKPWYEAGANALAEQQRLLGLGATGRGTPEYGSMARPFSMADFRADPGYAFRLKEGQKALERSAAARGGLLSGGTGAALTRYGQEMGSQEYQNAFKRYQIEREARLAPLQSLAGQGQTTAGTLSSAGQNYATTAGQAGVDLATINAARGLYGTNLQNQMLNQIMGRVSAYGA